MPPPRIDVDFETAKKLRAVLVDWLLSAKDLGWSEERSLSEDAVRALMDLGYAAELEYDQSDKDAAFFDAECRCPDCRLFKRRS